MLSDRIPWGKEGGFSRPGHCFVAEKVPTEPCVQFFDAKGHIDRVEVARSAGAFSSKCTCGENGNKSCQHAAAAMLHAAKLANGVEEAEGKEGPAKFAGLKFEGLPELISQTLSPPQATILLQSESEFPHVPSKWERSIFSLSLRYGSREYTGNLSNIRQLHFGKSMAASLDISFFPQQDRQIIRYLAINSEAEGSKLSLDAEQTAEFFHCLKGFGNFVKGGEHIIVHSENAEPVLLCQPRGEDCVLRSSVMIDGSFLQLEGVKVITGRAGCWIGMSGEYWWIPASVDLAWLRNFLRTTEQKCDRTSAELLLSGKTSLPIRIFDLNPKEIRQKKCSPLYLGDLSTEGSLELELQFLYDGKRYPGNGGRLAHSDGGFWKRDTKLEKEAMEELTGFGCSRIKGHHAKFVLYEPEAIGIFLDELIASWMTEKRHFCLSEKLASLCRGGSGVAELKLACRVEKENPHNFELRYTLAAGQFKISWKELEAAVRNHQTFLMPEAQTMIKISPALARFAAAVADIVHLVKEDEGLLKIPRFAAPYWADVAGELRDAVPPEFIGMRSCMQSFDPSHAPDIVPGGFEFHGELRNYQRQGVSWMRELGSRGFNLILADEMGLGKTVQALAMLALCAHKSSRPSLLLCPTSLVENWLRETKRFVPSFKAIAIMGHDREELWKQAREAQLVITSYTLAKRDHELFKETHFDYVILDEAQHIKNPSTANAKICKSIHSAHRLVLTGTPLENSPEDLWSIFDFLHPGLLGSFHSFKEHYAEIHLHKEKQDELAARVAPFILRRRKKEVYSELPPKQEQILFCEMDPEQRKIYEQFLGQCREQCQQLHREKKQTSIEVLTNLLRLRQICCHPELLPPEFKAGSSPSAKMELLQELVLENIDSGHKLLLFSQFTSLLKIIREWLDKEGIKYEYLDGSTKDRLERVDNFNNNSKIPLFLLSLKAGGTGLNLTSADTVIIYDPWWNPAVETQATDRTHRIGQTRSVNSMKLVVKNSVEERILTLQDRKRDIFQCLVDDPAAAMSQLSFEDLEFLLQ